MRPSIVVLLLLSAGLAVSRFVSPRPQRADARVSLAGTPQREAVESAAEVALDTPFGEDLAGCPMDTVFRHQDPSALVEEFVRRDAEGPMEREDLARAWEAGAVSCVERTSSDDYEIITRYEVTPLAIARDTARFVVRRDRAYSVRFDPRLARRRLIRDAASIADTMTVVRGSYGWRIDALRAGAHRLPERALTELELVPAERARLERLVASGTH